MLLQCLFKVVLLVVEKPGQPAFGNIEILVFVHLMGILCSKGSELVAQFFLSKSTTLNYLL